VSREPATSTGYELLYPDAANSKTQPVDAALTRGTATARAEGRGVEQGRKGIEPLAGLAALVVEEVALIAHALD
jgi:hypothetical protein